MKRAVWDPQKSEKSDLKNTYTPASFTGSHINLQETVIRSYSLSTSKERQTEKSGADLRKEWPVCRRFIQRKTYI